MNTIQCRIKLDDYTDIAGNDVTPAEVVILRALHSKQAKGDPIVGAYRGGVALRNGVPRTDEEEYNRLLSKYPGKNPKTDRLIVEELLGNRFQRLPQTFDEIKLEVAAAPAVSAEDKQNARVVADTWGSGPAEGGDSEKPADEPSAEAVKARLLTHNRGELLKMATDLGATVEEGDTKARLVEKILIESGAVPA